MGSMSVSEVQPDAHNGAEGAVPRPSVLVVDDSADVRESLRLLLKGAGYTVISAASPEAALAAAQ
jgi:CheY-like chemotaxis protein